MRLVWFLYISRALINITTRNNNNNGGKSINVPGDILYVFHLVVGRTAISAETKKKQMCILQFCNIMYSIFLDYLAFCKQTIVK